MDIKSNTLLLSLIKQLMDINAPTEAKIPLSSGKPPFKSVQAPISKLPRTAPENVGIRSSYIAAYIRELKSCSEIDPHNILIIKDGKLIGEFCFGGYKSDIWQITHSECKSITGIAIGMLIDEKKLGLDDLIVDIFGKKSGILGSIMHKNITVRHLLTMTSGVIFAEGQSMTSTDWVKDYFSSASPGEPGKNFNYNSLNTYLLSAIVKEKTGLGLTEYLKPRLFEPLGIKTVYWEKCPNGIEKGGWGLYIHPEDIAKIGLLVMNKGKWNGVQLVSEQWLDEATKPHIQPPKSTGNYSYGYQIWVGKESGSFLFNGMFGQNVFGWRNNGVMVISNCGNGESFQQSPLYTITERYFGGTEFISAPSFNPMKQHCLRQVKKEITAYNGCKKQNYFRMKSMMKALDGVEFICPPDKGAALGIYPLLVQAMQNNYTKGLQSIGFEYIDRKLLMVITEKNARNIIELNFDKPSYTTISYGPESQEVAVSSRFAYNENDEVVIDIRISFLELSNSRLIKLIFHKDELICQWSETPGIGFVNTLLAYFKEKVHFGSILSKDDDIMAYRIERMLSTRIKLKKK